MTTLTMDSVVTPELTNDSDVAFKAISGQIGIDKAQGIVECFVSAIGNKDSVGDVVMPGAFNSSLKRRKPRVVWGHDWNQPIGKVLDIYEVPRSDPRLPEKMKKAKVGGLFAKVQFNLNTERGREAFANVAFYGNDQEWSIGYKTLVADFNNDIQANMLKEVELYEVSPVLHGANQLTGTISVKDAEEKGGLRNTQMADPSDARSVLRSALSRALNKPIEIIDLDDNTVVFQSGPNMTWQAGYHREGNQFMVGAPTRVKPMTTYMPMDGSVPESLPKGSGYNPDEEPEEPMMPMGLKEEGVKMEGMHGVVMRDGKEEVGEAEDPQGFTSMAMARAWSKTLMCDGVHSHEGRFYPCEDRATYLMALEKFDNNANLNAQDMYEADVSEDESVAKKDAEPCSCETETKGGGKYRRGPSESVQRDPMALLLMAYNAMIPLKGAGKEREATLALISMVEDFMVKMREEQVEVVIASKKATSGFVVTLKCDEAEAFEVLDNVKTLPVLPVRTEDGIDLLFAKDYEHDDLLEKVAFSIAGLSFEPEVSSRFEEEHLDTEANIN